MAGKPEFNKNISSFCLFRIPTNGRRVIWEVTNQCNYNCPYCIFSSSIKKEKNELSGEKAQKLIAELKEKGFTHLKITGGEPFMRADMIELLHFAKKIGFKTDISTNASRITDEMAEKIAALDLEMVHISLDGHTKEIQEKARGKGSFEGTVRGIKRLVAKKTPYIRIGCLIFKENEDKLDQVAMFCKNLGVNEVIFSLMEPVGRGAEVKGLMTEKSQDHFKKVLSKIKISGLKISYSFSQQAKSCEGCRCPGGDKFLFINQVGEVSPCTWITERNPEYIYKKTLQNHSLAEVMKDDRFLSLTKTLENLECDTCPAQSPLILKEVQGLKNKIEASLKKEERFHDFSPAYVFSTENLTGVLEKINVRGKKVLTIAGSGDHLLNMELFGAKSVDCFDISICAKYMMEIKKVAARKLSYKEFKKFFLSERTDQKSYSKIRSTLSLPCRYIFENQKEKCVKKLYISEKKIILNNPYLKNESSYLKLRKIKNEGRFIQSDIKELHHNLTESYDIVYLSNIIDYAHQMYKGDYLKQFMEKNIRPLLKHLNPGGKIVVGYIYDMLDKNGSSQRSKINIPTERQKTFAKENGFNYREEKIGSAIETGNQDAVLILEQTQEKNLLEKSDIYYKKADIYEKFAKAEDKSGKIADILKKIFKGKDIVDMGCGTGKYMEIFSKVSDSILGFDAAGDQLKIAKEKTKALKNVTIKSGDAEKIVLPAKKYDYVFASWMLGTVTDLKKREKILKNIKKALKKDGKIILVENDEGGEFEDLRGRVNDPKERTKKYNAWLEKKGFNVLKRIKTQFEFSSVKEAKEVIGAIWGESAASKIKKKTILHKIVIFRT